MLSVEQAVKKTMNSVAFIYYINIKGMPRVRPKSKHDDNVPTFLAKTYDMLEVGLWLT